MMPLKMGSQSIGRLVSLRSMSYVTLAGLMSLTGRPFRIRVHCLGQRCGSAEPRGIEQESLSRIWDDLDYAMIVAADAARSDGNAAYDSGINEWGLRISALTTDLGDSCIAEPEGSA